MGRVAHYRRFEQGDAQAMPFPDETFDVVINIDPNVQAFLSEVVRALKPGGCFLLGDYRRAAKMPHLRNMLLNTGLDIVLMEDITANIVSGLEHQESRKREFIAGKVPAFLRNIVLKFAGLDAQGDSERDLFMLRQKVYLAAVLRRREPSADAQIVG
jgi:SAM-dependent methyltransferase